MLPYRLGILCIPRCGRSTLDYSVPMERGCRRSAAFVKLTRTQGGSFRLERGAHIEAPRMCPRRDWPWPLSHLPKPETYLSDEKFMVRCTVSHGRSRFLTRLLCALCVGWRREISVPEDSLVASRFVIGPRSSPRFWIVL